MTFLPSLAPPSGSASETNNKCQIKFELLQLKVAFDRRRHLLLD